MQIDLVGQKELHDEIMELTPIALEIMRRPLSRKAGSAAIFETRNMSNLLWLFQTLTSMLESPITLVAIAFSFGLGLWQRAWWIPSVVAVIAVLVSALVLSGHWQRLGIDLKTQIWTGACLFAILTYLFFGAARFLIHLLHLIEPRPSLNPEEEDGEK